MRALGRAMAVCGATALVCVLASACGASKGSPQPTSALQVSASGYVGATLPAEAPHDFALTDERGRSASTREYRGRVVVLAFLGTSCGAPCVVIADQVRGALDELSKPVPALLVSVQP